MSSVLLYQVIVSIFICKRYTVCSFFAPFFYSTLSTIWYTRNVYSSNISYMYAASGLLSSTWHLPVTSLHLKSWTSLSASFAFDSIVVSERSGRAERSASLARPTGRFLVHMIYHTGIIYVTSLHDKLTCIRSISATLALRTPERRRKRPCPVFPQLHCSSRAEDRLV